MPKSKEIQEPNEKVIEIYQSGKGYKAISKVLGLQKTTARAIIHKWRERGTVVNLPRSGRPTKITPRAQRQLIQEVTKDPTTTSKNLQGSLASVKTSSLGGSFTALSWHWLKGDAGKCNPYGGTIKPSTEHIHSPRSTQDSSKNINSVTASPVATVVVRCREESSRDQGGPAGTDMRILCHVIFLVMLGGISCQNNRNAKPSGKPAKKASSTQAAEVAQHAPDEDLQPGPGAAASSSKDTSPAARGGTQQGASTTKPVEDMKLHFLKNTLATCNDGTAAGFVPYCSSDVWSGNKPATKAKQGKETEYSFMGSVIIREMIKDLASKGLKQAKVVMLAGTSAGGTGVLLNIEKVASQLEQLGADVQVRGLVDSGWFLESKQQKAPDCPDSVSCSPVDAIKKGIRLWNGVIPEKCKQHYKRGEEWQCFFGHKLYSFLSSPLFVVQWLFDEEQLRVENIYMGGQSLSEQQWTYMQNLGKELKNSLKDVTAVFAPSCLSHTLITRSKWMEFQVKGTSLSRALQCWDRSLQEANKSSKTALKGCPFHLIDGCQWPQCNPTCPALIDQATQQEMTLLQVLASMGLDLQKLGLDTRRDSSTSTGMISNVLHKYSDLVMSLSIVTTTEYEDYSNTSNFDYNNFIVPCEKDANRNFRFWFLPTIYSIICFLALLGNFLVILTYLYFKRLKTMTDIFLLNLAMADLLFALSLPFWAASVMTKWQLGQFLCKAMHGIYKISFFSGMFLLTCISVDRYYSITKAVSAHRCRSSAIQYGRISSLVTWVLAVIFSLPEIIYSDVSVNSTCVAYSKGHVQLRVSMQVSQMVLGFVLPALVMGFCYSCIIKTLVQARNFEKNKALKVIFAVVAVFVVSQLPYNVVLGLTTQNTTICDYDNSLLYAMDVTRGIAFLRCCVNPFLYAFIGVKFRNDLLKLMKDLGCLSQRHFIYSYGKRKSSAGFETETTTSFSP
ncbi:hypothetical protein NFI96_008824 [Prochilodus magdalenae]|nr:hypothetical protein NFI96_008824 [Prochilodus magdalenae]